MLWRIAAFSLLGFAVTSCISTSRSFDGDPATPTQDELAEGFFDRFPSESFSEIAEAEREAGFDIPVPGSAYRMGFGQTVLQWYPQSAEPISTTEYTYEPLAPTSIGLVVGPEHLWATRDRPGRDALTQGSPTRIGERDGWLRDMEGGWLYKFVCGKTEREDLWCAVRAADKIGWPAFEEFVSTIR